MRSWCGGIFSCCEAQVHERPLWRLAVMFIAHVLMLIRAVLENHFTSNVGVVAQ